jgi:hypothetical protein
MLTVPVIITGVIMVLALIGMVICAKKQRTYPNAQPFAIGLLVVVIICGVVILYKTGTFGDTETQRLIANEMKFAKSKAIVLGEKMRTKYPGVKTLVVANHNYQKSQRQQELIAGLKEGLGIAAITVVDTLEFPEKDERMGPGEIEMMPLEEMMTSREFDALLKKHPDCRLVITMIGLPRDASGMKLWTQDESKRPALAMLNGEIHSLKNAIKAGLIAAAVSYRPGIKFSEDPCPENPQEAFDERYIIITPENVDEMAAKYDKLFME